MRRSRALALLVLAGLAGAATVVSGTTAEAGTTVRAAKPKPPPPAYTPLSPSPCGTMSVNDGQAHQIKHVVWLMFENKARATVFGDPTKDPYLGGLALACGQASNYQSTPDTPAKIAMASGKDWGLANDGAVVPGPDLYSQLGTDWKQYMGSMPSNCYQTNTKDKLYLADHNAAVFFTDAAAACATQDVPLPASPAALDLSHKFTLIEANVPQSMHGCSIAACGADKWAQLAIGDTWAKTWVAGLFTNTQYLAGDTVVFIVWDQGGTATGSNTAFIAVSPYTTPGQVSTTLYTHYSLLRGTEDLLGLPALEHAGDATTNSVANDFGLPYPAVVPPPPPPPTP